MAASASARENVGGFTRKSLSLVQAAAILEVHRNTLAKWIDQGCPVLSKADRDRGIEWAINVGDVVQWRITKSVEDAISGYEDGNGNVSKDEADRRRSLATAITAEVAADEALDVVTRRHDAEADMAAFCLVVRGGLANASSKIASRAALMTSAPEIEELCLTEMNRAFGAARGELAKRWANDESGAAPDDGEGQPAP